ncbi:phosphoenolpyruvate synthase [Streptomyces sp. SID8382]|uniref:phosphoenolpyruvate synthase n=1 Tax=Streptomyces malaysiensis TaxID=92644 RepID=UPI000C2B57E4|nr:MULTISPECIES: phosphoenolpyruvate synthase [unclassified Streptomyces]AUA08968.1 Phosphoenolpyruvate synthase [Streptomyces sp. M56]MYX60803.1 phosphoenolpyruvate synthase [Streptomyces sp. SID8382]
MRAIVDDSLPGAAAKLAGGKGRNLHELSRNGLAVPRWAVVGLDVFQEFIAAVDGAGRIEELLAEVTQDNVSRISGQLAEIIESGELSDEAASVVEAAYAHVGRARVAVRSSGVEEDGSELSFAGQFATFLNVSGLPEVMAHVKKCWASAFSERSLHYRLRHGLPPRGEGLAVVVQDMVDAEVSGVIFTANPVTGDRRQHVVSSVYGLGEGLVSGAVDADTVVLDAATGAVEETALGEKRERYHLDPAGSGYLVGEVERADREKLSLSPKDIARLHEAGVRIAAVFDTPQDIEWALADDALWILQARPITALPDDLRRPMDELGPSEGELRIWDNANIIESFSGIVSPLTYSFAANVYGKVYEYYARGLRVPPAALREITEWAPHMLGYFHGRVYYNLLHWYRMVRIAPLYKLNRKVLEVAIGVEEPLDDETAERIYPYTFSSSLRGRLSRARTAAAFMRRFLTMNRSVERFMDYFYKAYEEFDNVDYDAMEGQDVYRRFRALEKDLLEKWGPMQTLDASILWSIGALALLNRRWLPDAPEWLTWSAASPGSRVESIEPARALARLAATVRDDAELSRLLQDTPAAHTYQALRDGGHTAFLASVDEYIAAYGYRSLDELKLEVADLREDPSSLFAMVRAALPEVDANPGEKADAYLDEHLRGPRRLLYDVVRRKAQSSLYNRERLRFCRTRAFGSAKRMLRAMGRDLARMGAIDHWNDVFFLRLEELRGAYEGTTAHTELRALVELRKRQKAEDEQLSAPSRFTTRGAAYWRGNLERAGFVKGGAARTGVRELRGTPSCPGVVEARAVVTDTPVDVDGGVLVTYRTDPGWVAALPSASALIIERGSPLTHVAIVARELGIPTVVQVKGVVTEAETGMRLRVDGGTGTITFLDDAPAESGALAGSGTLAESGTTVETGTPAESGAQAEAATSAKPDGPAGPGSGAATRTTKGTKSE